MGLHVSVYLALCLDTLVLWQVVRRLPHVDMTWQQARRSRSDVNGCPDERKRPSNHEDSEQLELLVELQRRGPRRATAPRVYAPRFPRCADHATGCWQAFKDGKPMFAEVQTVLSVYCMQSALNTRL